MPALSGNATTYRAGNYFALGYIGSLPQTIVHNGTLSATPTFPAQTIAITTVGGTSASVKRGMTVRIETSLGVLKGYCRIASSGTISNATLPINETSKGGVNLASGDVFKVYDTFRIWDMLAGATAALPKDSRIAYTDQGSNPDPIVNAGGGWFGFVDDGQVYATVTFDASVSINTDPDSSTTKTYVWVVGAGATITVGTSTTASITATFPVGFRHVQLTVTDSTNSKATVRQFPVQVYDRTTTLPLAVAQAELEYTPDDGWGMRFELPKGSESAMTTLPDGALVCFFLDEYYSGTRVSYGSNVSGRSHMAFIGHLVRDSITVDPENNTVVFEALSPLGILNKTPALPQLMVQNSGTGTLWRHVKTLNTNRMEWYLIRYGSTAMNSHDFVWQLTGSALNYRRIAVTEVSSIGAQLRDIAKSVNLLVTCDHLGRILLIQDFNYLSSANRSARTVVYNFTTADIKKFDFSNEHRGSVKFVRGEGITDGLVANSNKPVFSNSPGNAPAPFGTGSETLSQQIVDTQTDINERTGYRFAEVNGLCDGRFVPQNARLDVPMGYGWIDPAYNEPFTITLASTTNKRGASFDTTTRWLAVNASRSFDGEAGTIETAYTVNHETTGQAGTTYIKPQTAQNGLPDYTPIDLSMPVITLPNTTPPLFRGTANLAVFTLGSNTVQIVSDFNTPSAAGGPTVTNVSLTLNGAIQSVIGDPYSPLYLGTGSTVNCWIATTSRLYTVTDLFGVRTVTQRMVFAFAISNSAQLRRVLATERAVQNFVLCASYDPASLSGVHIARTTDGTTWTEAAINAFRNTSSTNPPNPRIPTVWVSGKIPGRAYAFAFTATGAALAATSELYQSDDYGATWTVTAYANNAQGLGNCLHFPWNNNDNDRYFFWTKNDTASSLQLMRSDRILGTQTVVNPLASGGQKAGSSEHPYAIDSSVLDRNTLVVAGWRNNGATFAMGLYGSRDFGANWEVLQTEIVSPANRLYGVRFAPNSSVSLYLVGEDSYGAAYSDNFGLLVDPRISANPFVAGIIGG